MNIHVYIVLEVYTYAVNRQTTKVVEIVKACQHKNRFEINKLLKKKNS